MQDIFQLRFIDRFIIMQYKTTEINYANPRKELDAAANSFSRWRCGWKQEGLSGSTKKYLIFNLVLTGYV